MTRRRLALLGLGSLVHAQTRLDEDLMWKEYLDWLAKQPFGSFLGLIDYRKKLEGEGVAKPDVAHRMAVISSRVYTQKEGMRLWFNTAYSTNKDFVADRPNAFLAQVVQSLHPGTALDVSMGQGRNSIFLAKAGWEVTGFDVSDGGLAIAREHAEEAGVKITAKLEGYQDFEFGSSRWDLIAMIYAFFPIKNSIYIDKVLNSLRRGGAVVIESRLLTDRHAEPDKAAILGITAPNELLRIFGKLRILHYEEFEGVPDFGTGTAPLVRLYGKLA